MGAQGTGGSGERSGWVGNTAAPAFDWHVWVNSDGGSAVEDALHLQGSRSTHSCSMALFPFSFISYIYAGKTVPPGMGMWPIDHILAVTVPRIHFLNLLYTYTSVTLTPRGDSDSTRPKHACLWTVGGVPGENPCMQYELSMDRSGIDLRVDPMFPLPLKHCVTMLPLIYFLRLLHTVELQPINY